MLTTTLRKLREAGACLDRYEHLVKSLGGIGEYELNTPIPLTVVLDLNGFADAIWAIRATVEESSQIARLLAGDCAEHTLAIFERPYPNDQRPRRAVEMSRRYAFGMCTAEELLSARAAADAAAYAAAYAMAYAADAAAYAAAADAAYAAAYAADDAADAARAAERNWQETRFRQYLNNEIPLTPEAFGL